MTALKTQLILKYFWFIIKVWPEINATLITNNAFTVFNETIDSSFTPFVFNRIQRNAFTVKHNSSTIHSIKTEEKPSRNYTNYAVQRPMFTTNINLQLPFDPEIYKCDQKQNVICLNKTIAFRDRILMEFRKSLEAVCVQCNSEMNVYNVEYEHPDDMIKYNPTCMVLDAKLRLLTKNDSPFDMNKIGRMFPTENLLEQSHNEAKTKSCIIVSSAGSLFRSNLGKFIGKNGKEKEIQVQSLCCFFFCFVFCSLIKSI